MQYSLPDTGKCLYRCFYSLTILYLHFFFAGSFYKCNFNSYKPIVYCGRNKRYQFSIPEHPGMVQITQKEIQRIAYQRKRICNFKPSI